MSRFHSSLPCRLSHIRDEVAVTLTDAADVHNFVPCMFVEVEDGKRMVVLGVNAEAGIVFMRPHPYTRRERVVRWLRKKWAAIIRRIKS